MNTYQVEKKVRGKKTEVRILLNGEEIGKRTSARPYRFVLLVKGNQTHALARAKANLEYARKQEVKYRAVANDEPGAREKFINFDSTGRLASAWARDLHNKYIAEGEVLKWADGQVTEIKRLEDYIARLSSGPQPEFDVIRAASWHHTRALVPTCKEYQIFVDAVEIPE